MDFHGTGQTQDVSEKSQEGSSIECVAEAKSLITRPMIDCNEHFQVRLFGQKGIQSDQQWHTTASIRFVCLFCVVLLAFLSLGGTLQGQKEDMEGWGDV